MLNVVFETQTNKKKITLSKEEEEKGEGQMKKDEMKRGIAIILS